MDTKSFSLLKGLKYIIRQVHKTQSEASGWSKSKQYLWQVHAVTDLDRETGSMSFLKSFPSRDKAREYVKQLKEKDKDGNSSPGIQDTISS